MILLVPAVVILLFTARQGVAAPLRLAVAANFTQTAQQLVAEFTQNTGISATISSGSSGQLFMQITQGAPFDIFLSADTKRPADLITSGMGVAASRFTYAIGQLVLWTPTTHTPPSEQELRQATFAHLAICNPNTAPYGTAAIETLDRLGLYAQLKPRLVVAQSVSQALELAQSGNAELAFVALAQVRPLQGGAYWLVPPALYTQIRQDAILLSTAKDDEQARKFMVFLHGAKAASLIGEAGYLTDASTREPTP
ncbi:molybdate ABC transporter substrate-binding protein [Komagataeibacter sp. FNDCR2]|uniref:molybdate ABC transporter substrate-binding protein n=1 Tax=Komagataeibacter sp. FNDCR2 TaxID=2878682 RepID=UPI001E49232A|nr:molybdate ABC transporter substrate-binding protein [Komagataeibacter sp. FNDCR2]MCE2575203.1 molybdate ABC transporter substrate-binding protein [Komagataeibacter sp. FNDCR2]